MRRLSPAIAGSCVSVLLLLGCGSDDGGATGESSRTAPASTVSRETEGEPARSSDDSDEELFPDVLEATATLDSDGTWTVSATVSSPYDSADRYADAWRVIGPDDTVYGIRELTHDHASEQPFTRSQSGIEIPDDVTQITIEGRDQVSGWGGGTATVDLVR